MVVNDMLQEIYDLLKSQETLKGISIKSFERPEGLDDRATSIVIKPVSVSQTARASNTHLAKRFTYQINVESVNRMECKELQRIIETTMEQKGFVQVEGSLEDYISHIKRYVDVRTYRGTSPLYSNY